MVFVQPIPQPNYTTGILDPLYAAQKQEAIVAAQEAATALAQQQAAQQAIVDTPAVTTPVVSSNDYTECAGYAKSRRPDIPNDWGNASNWLYAAESIGWPTGDSPRVGAVAWLIGGDHVAYVEAVNDDGTILISEANYNGSTYDERTTVASDWIYIY